MSFRGRGWENNGPWPYLENVRYTGRVILKEDDGLAISTTTNSASATDLVITKYDAKVCHLVICLPKLLKLSIQLLMSPKPPRYTASLDGLRQIRKIMIQILA